MPHRRDFTGTACAALVLLMNLATLPLALTEGDSGEWLVIARYGGIPHPSGYPLYALLIRGFALLAPPLPLVTAVTLLSCLCGAAAAWLTARALRQLGLEPAIAGCGTVAVFASAAVWRMTNMPEPFALSLLLAAAVLEVASRPQPASPRALLWLGALFGLGFCNHHSLVFMAPLGVYVILGHTRQLPRFALGFTLGLLPLAYLAVARLDASPYDYYPLEDLRDFVRLIFRASYGTFQLTPNKVARTWGSLSHFATHLPAWLSFVWLALGIGGLAQLFRRAPRGLAIAWSMSFVFSTVLFFRLFNIEVEGWAAQIVERFMALPVWLLVLPMAFGLELAGSWLVRWPAPRLTSFVALVFFQLVRQAPVADRRDATFFEDHVRAVFAVLPAAADQVVTASDAETLGVLHGRYILDLGEPTFRWLNAAHWPSRRFRERTVNALGLPEDTTQATLPSVVARLLEERGRIAVLDVPLPPRPKLFNHSFAIGPITVLVRPSDALPSADELWQMNEHFFSAVALPACATLGPWDRDLYAKYQAGLTTTADALTAASRPDLAARARALMTPCP